MLQLQILRVFRIRGWGVQNIQVRVMFSKNYSIIWRNLYVQKSLLPVFENLITFAPNIFQLKVIKNFEIYSVIQGLVLFYFLMRRKWWRIILKRQSWINKKPSRWKIWRKFHVVLIFDWVRLGALSDISQVKISKWSYLPRKLLFRLSNF